MRKRQRKKNWKKWGIGFAIRNQHMGVAFIRGSIRTAYHYFMRGR